MSAPKTASDAKQASGLGRWLVIGGVVIVAAALSALYGVNEYSTGVKVLVDDAAANANRFESVYRENTETRLHTLRLGLDILLQDDQIRDAFAKNDRERLSAKVTPLFNEVLKPRYALEQLNFFTPPAIVYLRTDDPKVFGNDLSAVRRSIVLAGERRQMVSGMETGLGGVVALRAVAPIFDGGRLVGTMGVGDGIADYLANAAEASGLSFALGLNRIVAERAERSPDPKNDAIHGEDVFTIYSSPAVGQILRTVSLDPRKFEPVLTDAAGRTIFIKTFPITNISGVPTVVVATLLDLTDAIAAVKQAAGIKAVILFLVMSVAGALGVTRFSAMKKALEQALVGQKRELEEKKVALEAARAKIKDIEQLKRGFLNNLVAALNEPLHAISGQLQAVGPAVDGALRGSPHIDADQRVGVVDTLRQAMRDTSRASRSISDYQQLELFRQKMVKVDTPLVSIASVIKNVLEEDVAASLRLTDLTVDLQAPDDLPRTRVDAGLLRRALAALIHEAAEGEGAGRLTISAYVDVDSWLAIQLSGPIFADDQAPTPATIETARRFWTEFSAKPSAPAIGDSSMGLALAIVIIDYFGGRLSAAPEGADNPGFIVQLPAAR